MSSREEASELKAWAPDIKSMQGSGIKLKASRELIRLTFSYFPEALENYFSKFRVLIP